MSNHRAAHDLVIQGGRVWSRGDLIEADVAIDGGRFADVGRGFAARQFIHAQHLWVLPGVIDGHTHMEAPAFGLLSHDTFESGTRAAAAGGVTTILDFTVSRPGATLTEHLVERIAAARTALVDFGLHAEVAGWRACRTTEISDAVAAGAPSLKFYTVYAERLSPRDLAEAFPAVAEAGGVAMVHAEDPDLIQRATDAVPAGMRGLMESFARARPAESEAEAVSWVVRLAETSSARVHFAHLSTALAADIVRRAKARGLPVTAETCPHYLTLDAAAYAGVDGRQYAVIPPLRRPEDSAALWEALADGSIDTVATDHCPFTRADKATPRDAFDVPCGLAGVETLLPLLYSEGVMRNRISLRDLARALCERPAHIFGLAPRKGTIEAGADADLVLFDPAKEWVVRTRDLHTNSDFSPYEGLRVRGAVRQTLVRGRPVWVDGEFPTDPGWGRFVPGVTAA